ncbi:ubiquitin 3 binding protein But2 C-terminal domain-containing protein [Sphaerosporella brunnea]|uniref:Ubiquitin 3 binding protein But2 C-terminal domain-containing protein n=1 Tax=Sphaerosporella brunnea TaxID=1250544 RepID=A0A5J5F8K9_9PEZI|nr:ubiquitin 3 binding protein But2 C-terminal domain-containing protein [Sphaerosporella brunnea]
MKFLLALTAVAVTAALAAPTAEDAPQSQGLLNVLFPNYLVPIYQANPDTAYPTQYEGDVSYTPGVANEVRLLVGFDVPANSGTRCLIKFRLEPKTPWGYDWTVTGTGKLDVWALTSIIQNGVTTWNSKPARTSVNPLFKIVQPLQGGDAAVWGAVIPCNGGQRMDFEVAATRPGATTFNWFELDYPKSGITMNMYT